MPPDPSQPKVVVVMPAYNAARTLVRTYRDIPPGVVDHVILVDDLSRDDTVAVAELLNLQVVVHRQNLGYGGNQKTCYDTALAEGADVVVMLHPDYQYDATRIPELVAPILTGEADMVLGSRFLGDPLAGGMPRWKYLANRFLTTLQNRAYDLRLSEYHTGFRAYSRKLLETINYQANSNDFVFDQELVGQVVRAGFRIAEIPVPTRYFAEASSVNFRRSVIYGLSTLRTLVQPPHRGALIRALPPRRGLWIVRGRRVVTRYTVGSGGPAYRGDGGRDPTHLPGGPGTRSGTTVLVLVLAGGSRWSYAYGCSIRMSR